ncbi:hypothetical protein NSND_60361 [Nitrospira sp. ND1]|nr:hypothetical protein NSND_60361 [Nitrospira sp. ND1]
MPKSARRSKRSASGNNDSSKSTVYAKIPTWKCMREGADRQFMLFLSLGQSTHLSRSSGCSILIP